MAFQCKNYTKPGGNVTVIGGKLILEAGTTIEGLSAAYQADAGSDINSVALIRTELNELLAKLRAAGLMEVAPTIAVTTQPADLALVVGAIEAADELVAEFAASNGGTLAYQWYSNITDSNEGGSAVDGATGASYAIPAATTAGTTYYYCVASHEGITKATDTAAVVVSAE